MEVLGKSKAIEIIVNLHKVKEAGFVEMVGLCGGSTATVGIRLMELEAIGLVEEEREAKFGGKRLFRLTEKGKKVAKRLVEVEKLLA